MTELKLENSIDAHAIKKYLIEKWDSLETNSDVFRYKLNVRKQTVLNGKYNFLIQVSIFAMITTTKQKQLKDYVRN